MTSELSARSRAALDALVLRAASIGERVVSVGRALFCAAVVVRFFFVREFWLPRGSHAVLLSTVLPAVGIAVSAYVLVRLARRRATERLFLISVVLDALVCFGALLPNVLWPGPHYAGFLKSPDFAVLLVVLFTATFRLSTPAALVASSIHLASSLVLVALDVMLPPVTPLLWTDATFFALLFGSTMGLTIAGATQTRRLVTQAAVESIRAERARRNLGAVLADHHDLRSLLSAAAVNAGLLVREVERAPERRRVGTIATELRTELEAINVRVRAVEERAYGELALLSESAPVHARDAIDALLPALAHRYPDVAFEVDVPRDGRPVQILGGLPAFEKIASNLLVNACEGDGVRGARWVSIRARADGARTVLEVEDDGPGFPASMLNVPGASCVTTKANGAGFGLFLVDSVVHASGGTFQKANRDEGGARVTFSLPIAIAPSDPADR